ncbi:MAG: hypothetical protein Ta2E_11040 [Mycoplasmoidaceae bacterium]|nr:MAG: hypothetical protein Ta2E_11040 [Mycoplasmoidaceae bacterium]
MSEDKIPPVLNNEYKKLLQARYALDLEDEFYTVTKIDKRKYQSELKDGVANVIKPKRNINANISIDDKVSSNYLIDKQIDIEKRLGFNENKLQKTKKNVKKIVSDFYDEPAEQLYTGNTNTTPANSNTPPEQTHTTRLESKLNEVSNLIKKRKVESQNMTNNF